ncbi:hypothetical protein [Microcella sp.]|uniref:hypothetical protein n=1 Tax=Microcella sp. TaxID=1913979 RepID=UPI003F70D8D7
MQEEDEAFFDSLFDREAEELVATAKDVLRRLLDRSPRAFARVIREHLPEWEKLRSLPVDYPHDLNVEGAEPGVGIPFCPLCATPLEKFIYVEEGTRRVWYACDDADQEVWREQFSDRFRVNNVIYLCDACEAPFELPESMPMHGPRFY